MAYLSNLDSITLPHWPSCNDCLTSSDDEIACASGADVHILTPRSRSSKEQAAWEVTTIKVNQFLESEWPVQNLAPSSIFSIGEEQGDSLVVTCSWSPSGLGQHRRAVLAVLTSNLVLSLWENDGSPGQFRRTCIINQFLGAGLSGDGNGGRDRLTRRVRAFAWNPVLKGNGLPRHGLFYLTVADDNGTVHLLHIAKPSTALLGQFTIEVSASISLHDMRSNVTSPPVMSPLQARLFHQSKISRIIVSEWQPTKGTSTTQEEFTSSLGVFKDSLPFDLNVFANVVGTVNIRITTREGHPERSLHPTVSNGSASECTLQQRYIARLADTSGVPVDLEQYFRHSLKPLVRSFNDIKRLSGNHKVHFWGVCSVLQTSIKAACITIHPSDMIEHTQPSTEICHVIFSKSSPVSQAATVMEVDTATVQKQILRFAVSQLQNMYESVSDLDMKLLAGLASLARLSGAPSADQEALQVAWLQYSTGSNGTGNAEPSVKPQAYELCEICSEPISFLGSTSSARCASGHLFTRCNLSFLTIQRPGISKYCSGCSRQYLDLAKLGPDQNPELVPALFDEFDSCPYCHAKFRG